MSAEALSFNTKRVDEGDPDPDTAPVIRDKPAVSGKQLTCDHGQWQNVDRESDFTYLWVRVDDDKIIGHDQTYTPTSSRALRRRPTPTATATTTSPAPSRPPTTSAHRTSASRPACSSSTASPTRSTAPTISIDPANEPNPLKQTATCTNGQWVDAYADHPVSGGPGYDYRYQWVRREHGDDDAAYEPIAGATGTTFQLTPDILGRDLVCQVTAEQPARRAPVRNSARDVHPAARPATQGYYGSVLYRHRDNENDPVNFIAYDDHYRQALVEDHRPAHEGGGGSAGPDAARRAAKSEARHGRPRRSRSAALHARRHRQGVSCATACYLLKSEHEPIVYADNVYYQQHNQPNCLRQNCIVIQLPINPVDPDTAAGLTSERPGARSSRSRRSASCGTSTATARTDISCPGTAPVVRTKLDLGYYPKVTR